MLRGTIAVAIVGLSSISLFAIAEENAAPSAEPEAITFTPVKTEVGEMIQVTAGIVKFCVPSIRMQKSDGSLSAETKAEHGILKCSTDDDGRQARIGKVSLYLRPARQVPTALPSHRKNSN
jgi:hypothetical protein